MAAVSPVLPSAGGTIEVAAQMGEGWTYFSLLEPSDADFEIVQITRDIDGDGDQDVLNADNWWLTDRTFPAEGRPTNENVLHILDDSVAGKLVYTITYGGEIAPNVAPTAVDDAATTTAGSGIEVSVLGNDEDANACTLAISGFSQAANGTVTYAAGGVVLSSSASGYVGALLYTPDEGFVGTDSFNYTIVDNQGGSSSANVTVTVTPDDGDEIVVETRNFDDGRVQDTTYVNGVRSEVATQDLGDAFEWSERTVTFDENGSRATYAQTNDDGRLLEIDYVNGVRAKATRTDVENVEPWAEIVTNYDAQGNPVDRTTLYDDGRVDVTNFTDDFVS